MRWLALACTILIAGAAWGQMEKPASLLINGAFERSGGWSRPPAARVEPSDRGGHCLHLVGEGGVVQDLPAEGGARTYSCSVEVRTANIVANQPAGYAYAAVYQLDDHSQLVAYRDFVQLRGSQEWGRHDFTFTLAPGATVISLRCGIFNAQGEAWFDNWTLVEGERAHGIQEVQEGGAGMRAGGSVAVLREPSMPVKGAASSPERLGGLLSAAGLKVSYLSATELADSRRLRPSAFDLVVLPYGQSFPAAARQSMIAYLHRGGGFISTGGYAFNNLLVQQGNGWVDEAAAHEAELQEALKHSVLPDGGFETTAGAPVGGVELDGRWHRDGDICTIVEEDPKEGKRCAKVTVRTDQPREDRWYLNIAPQPGMHYQVSGWIRTENVTPLGAGFAYLALYEWGDDNRLGPWKDFAHITGTHGWQQFRYEFTPAAGTKRIEVKMGLYRATGTAWFDDVRISNITGLGPQPMNTSTGRPADGLEIAATQIGAFDADYPLRRAVSAVAGGAQYIVPADTEIRGELRGWAASGVQGMSSARWVQLLEGRDRFGRTRGPIGALMMHYGGFFAGSMWGYFGVENRDLFDGSLPALDQAFVRLARFMAQGTYLHGLEANHALYRSGEPVRLSAVIENQGAKDRSYHVTFSVEPEGDRARAVDVGASEGPVAFGTSARAECQWTPARLEPGTYRVRALLRVDGQAVDEMETGFLVADEAVPLAGPELRFRDNYFHLNGRPVFLFGSDTYSNVYQSDTENPWTWHLDHVAARDWGFNVYENLQFSHPPKYEFSDDEWRAFEAMAQSCQREGLVFMPCQLVGHNVAIGEDLLQRQAAQCKAYAEHLSRYPGLLYYLNGDFFFRVDDAAAMAELWNRWLAEKYGSEQNLRDSWGAEVYGEWGKLAYPPPRSGAWGSVRECDRARFDVWVTQRWVSRHVDAVHSADPAHPITSEYYGTPNGGLDLPLTIDGQDASNIGFFDGPYRDEETLPLRLKFVDLRMRGKSLGLGEYGVKTHPAWSLDNGASGYHIVRTEEEQKRLFMAVAHYGLGLGACKVQNWCLRDSSERVFPWGVFYPNGRVPKDVACWHRNLSLVWRHFAPRYEAPPIAVLEPDGLRLGAAAGVGVEAANNAFRALLGLHSQFNVINEEHTEALGPQTRLLIWPSPLCPSDACYQKVLQWVRDGGTLLVTGDLSRNWDRRRTRTERLRELCGAEFIRELTPPPGRSVDRAESVTLGEAQVSLSPCIEVRPLTEGALRTASGVPAVVTHTLGRGRVVYCADPLELGAAVEVVPTLRALYAWVARGVSGLPDPGTDAGPDVHVCRQPLTGGGEFVTAYNTNMPPGAAKVNVSVGPAKIGLNVAARYPAMAATNGEGAVVAAGVSGEASVNGQPLISGDAQAMYLSLDGRALGQSGAVLLCPFSAGKTALHSMRQWQDPVTVLGTIEDGQWRTLEVRAGAPQYDLDEDTMTCLLLVCERSEQDRWTRALTQATQHPDKTEGRY